MGSTASTEPKGAGAAAPSSAFDADALLMPPPPPRPPKRPKTAVTPPPPPRAGTAGPPPPASIVSIVDPPPSVAPLTDGARGRAAPSSSDDATAEGAEGRVEPGGFEAGDAESAGGAQSRLTAPRDDAFANEDADEDANEVTAAASSRQPPQGGAKKSASPGGVGVSFRDIVGHGQAKLRLDEALLPLALPPDLAASVLTGIRAAPASILLHGPPGCGKTKLAKAVAGEAGAAFLSVGPSDVLSKFVGESEASIRGLFREARRRARRVESRCAVVFFDEVDALGRSRVDEEGGGKASQGGGGDSSSRRVLAELLIQMTTLSNDNGETGSDDEEEGEEDYDGYCDDGDSYAGRSTISTGPGMFLERRPGSSGARPMSPMLLASNEEPQVDRTPTRSGGENNGNDNPQPKPRVIVVAATNRPEDCDPALLRRFAVRVLVGLPSTKDRKRIIKKLLSDVLSSVTNAQLDELALETEGWSGSDLESMTREAAMAPVREALRAAARKKKAGKADSRETLLNSFRNLRPVSFQDFSDAIRFFLGDQNGFGRASYDSSSDEDEEEEEEEEESQL